MIQVYKYSNCESTQLFANVYSVILLFNCEHLANFVVVDKILCRITTVKYLIL